MCQNDAYGASKKLEPCPWIFFAKSHVASSFQRPFYFQPVMSQQQLHKTGANMPNPASTQQNNKSLNNLITQQNSTKRAHDNAGSIFQQKTPLEANTGRTKVKLESNQVRQGIWFMSHESRF
jgi:prophage antirepressor-like protein